MSANLRVAAVVFLLLGDMGVTERAAAFTHVSHGNTLNVGCAGMFARKDMISKFPGRSLSMPVSLSSRSEDFQQSREGVVIPERVFIFGVGYTGFGLVRAAQERWGQEVDLFGTCRSQGEHMHPLRLKFLRECKLESTNLAHTTALTQYRSESMACMGIHACAYVYTHPYTGQEGERPMREEQGVTGS